jgi:hypothetical protein
MARFFEWFFQGLGRIILWMFRAIGDTLADLLREIGRGFGRLIARVLPWGIGALAIIGLVKYSPDTLVQLGGIGILVFAFWVMVRGIIPGRRK